MRGERLTDKQVLDRLILLSEIIKKPKMTSKLRLAELSGVSSAKLDVLLRHEIVKFAPVEGRKGSGRKMNWTWIGPRPNTLMVQKLKEEQLRHSRERNGAGVKENVIALPSSVDKPTMQSKVVVRKEYSVLKSIEGFTAKVILKEDSNNLPTVAADLPNRMGAKELKCYGYAFLTAAEELAKEKA